MDNTQEVNSKRLYEKPSLRTIQLAAEEVLVTKCKQSSAQKIRSIQGCGYVSCNQAGAS